MGWVNIFFNCNQCCVRSDSCLLVLNCFVIIESELLPSCEMFSQKIKLFHYILMLQRHTKSMQRYGWCFVCVWVWKWENPREKYESESKSIECNVKNEFIKSCVLTHHLFLRVSKVMLKQLIRSVWWHISYFCLPLYLSLVTSISGKSTPVILYLNIVT